MESSARRDSRDRILDAAERAMAEGGFAGASLRTIAGSARVSLPSIYYYFRSKEGLMAAACERRLGPIRRAQLDLLERCRREAGNRPPAVERILEAILVPPWRLATESPARSAIVQRLVGRIATEPNRRIRGLLAGEHRDVREACLAAMREALPDRPPEELGWGLDFVWGALAIMLGNPREAGRDGPGTMDPGYPGRLIPRMVRFFSAGLRGDPGSGDKDGRKRAPRGSSRKGRTTAKREVTR